MECVHSDGQSSCRPERRKALVGRELTRNNADIAVLSKTCLAEEGQLNEIGAGCTFFWSGSAKNSCFAIKYNLVKKPSSLPSGVNDQLMASKLLLPGEKQASYVATLTIPDDANEKFCKDWFHQPCNQKTSSSLSTSIPE